VGVDSTGAAAGHPVDLKIGPGGDLFYVDMDDGTIHRITYVAANQAPTARIAASPTSGGVPLTVSFDGTGSSDPEGRPLSYSWDLNGDGAFGDSTAATTSFTYSSAGTYTARLRVTDDQNASDTASVTITAGNTAPTAVIDLPSPSLTWKVGDPISFAGHATDTQDGTLPASALSWSVIMHHCYSPTDCHTHLIQQFPGVSGGSFSAPDHQYPCWLEIQLTATDSGGLVSTASVRIDPRTVVLTFKTNPGGLKLSNLSFNESAQATPFSVTVVVGSANSVFAPSPQTFNRSTYYFSSWSDGSTDSTRTVVAPAVNTTYTATYRKR
jgi:PKD repeat protein